MPTTVDEIENLVRHALSSDFRGRLIERGIARSMIWKNGTLPPESPNFATTLSYDLLSYGYSLLSLAIQLVELQGNKELCYSAFERAATSIAGVIHNGPNTKDKGFHKVLAASSYHLGHYSAKSFSLLQDSMNDDNLSEMEKSLTSLILRDFKELEQKVLMWKSSGVASDENLADKLESRLNLLSEQIDVQNYNEEYGISSIELPLIDIALTDNYYSIIFEFLFALETGNQELIENVNSDIDNCIEITSELNMTSQWWIFKISKYLIKDLWESSFHKIIPVDTNQNTASSWMNLRWLFIVSLYNRKKAEIELWPSQIEGAKRIINDNDNLVVSLPTSAGKTRIAELAILRCLAIWKRVLFITPLRALSAQTESTLRKTFLPLNKTISTLYGSMGTNDFEQDVLKTKDIVVGTPEKLDFALRNDPSLIDDVGLIVLDEGHMIGLNEREINYEVQIQRLLNRNDASCRRIVCLSAILPTGDQFDDFSNWLRRDQDGEAIQSSWRPTDLRFGEVIWNGENARLNFTIGEEKPFIPTFIVPKSAHLPNPGVRTKLFPNDQSELTLATAWKLIEDEHTVLIYCPEKRSVNSFAKKILDLNRRGALDSIIGSNVEKLEIAKNLGEEWLGANNPIVECLDIGVAIHHGSLPTPFRKEIESLLREGVLKVTVSSPTLAQGLNLGATAVIFSSIYRNGDLIDGSEFKNVIGRAGRAFVDTHGLVLFPIFDRHTYRTRMWHNLISDTNTREMESGLVLLVYNLIKRMYQSIHANNIDDVLEYILNTNNWDFPLVVGETDEKKNEEETKWINFVENLDTALISMLGEEDVSIDQIASKLELALNSSLWQRRLNRQNSYIALFNSVLVQRANFIWKRTTSFERKGYFLAGVGLSTGKYLDNIGAQANKLLVNANKSIIDNEIETTITSVTSLAELIFSISPFIPKNLPSNWKYILEFWLKGYTLTSISFDNINDVLEFVEEGIVYRLIWGIESVRVRALANEDLLNGILVGDYELGLLVPSLENGTLNRSVAILMQAGFNSRIAAINAIETTNAIFSNGLELESWLNSEMVARLSLQDDWPTASTSKMWKSFRLGFKPLSNRIWQSFQIEKIVNWQYGFMPIVNLPVKLENINNDNTIVVNSKGDMVGSINECIDLVKNGVYYCLVNDRNNLQITFWGESNNPFKLKE